jgi:hypothetical protein
MIAQKIVTVGVYLKEDLHQRMQSGSARYASDRRLGRESVVGRWTKPLSR